MQNIVYFSHGKGTDPFGPKIVKMSETARAKGFQVEAPDYRFSDDPEQRVEKLLSLKPKADGLLVLWGSSMGSYVSTVVSPQVKPDGLFLLAPAFYKPGYANQDPVPRARKTVVVHGWRDDIIPVEAAIRFSHKHRTDLHILDSDHMLMDVLPEVDKLFAQFLDELLVSQTRV
jgi:alpha/beta superfamily hydrolase